jgi:hypothetical protein
MAIFMGQVLARKNKARIIPQIAELLQRHSFAGAGDATGSACWPRQRGC